MENILDNAEAVIFDMDGVIIDSEPLYDQSLKAFLFEKNKTISLETIEDIRGQSSKSIWAVFKKDFDLSESVEELVAAYETFHLELLTRQKNIQPIIGVKELIHQLHQKSIPTALASSSPFAVINKTLDLFEMHNYFSVKTSGTEVAKSKPAPDVFLLTAKRLNVDPSVCFVIEDSKNGVAAAKAADMYCIGFKGMLHNQQDLSKADHIITSFDEILP